MLICITNLTVKLLEGLQPICLSKFTPMLPPPVPPLGDESSAHPYPWTRSALLAAAAGARDVTRAGVMAGGCVVQMGACTRRRRQTGVHVTRSSTAGLCVPSSTTRTGSTVQPCLPAPPSLSQSLSPSPLWAVSLCTCSFVSFTSSISLSLPFLPRDARATHYEHSRARFNVPPNTL